MSAAVEGLPLAALRDWLQRHVAPVQGELRVTPLAGGQSNPTYRLRDDVHDWVLRRKPPGVLLASAHAVEREFRVMCALAGTAVPVPRMHALCEDASVIGSSFYVMDFVAGRVFADPSLPGLAPAERAALFDEMNRVVAALHAVDVNAVGLSEYGRPRKEAPGRPKLPDPPRGAGEAQPGPGGTMTYLARQLDRWTKQYLASLGGDGERIEAMERLIVWLSANLPAGDEVALVHGDFRIDNLIFHPTEPRVLAVLDWELSTLGHPLVDFAYHLMTWRVTPDEFRGLKGHDLAALGIPDEAAYVAAYCRRSGRAVLPHLEFYLAFNMFRMAAILQGILARARQGSAASADAERTGRQARPMAEAGWRLVQQLQAADPPR